MKTISTALETSFVHFLVHYWKIQAILSMTEKLGFEAVGLVSHDEDESEPSLEPGPPGV